MGNPKGLSAEAGLRRFGVLSFRVFKSLDRYTAVLEVYEGDALIAEIFAGDDGVRRLYLSDEAIVRGIDWNDLVGAAPKITAMLDQGDAEMGQVRSLLGG